MERMSSATQSASTPERPTSELVKELTELIPRLVRDELKLAQGEMRRTGRRAGLGAGMLGASGLIALYGVGCLLACAVIALSGAVAAWLSALIVGAALLAAAGASAIIGRLRLRKATPPVPREAISSARTDVREIKERARG